MDKTILLINKYIFNKKSYNIFIKISVITKNYYSCQSLLFLIYIYTD